MTSPHTPAPVSLSDSSVPDALDALVDVVVIGGGAAGLNSALMLVRSLRSVVVIDSGDPRNAPAEGIHGLLGNEGTPPAEYLERGREEVRRYGGIIVPGEVTSAQAAEPSADGDLRFTVDLADGRRLTARRLLVATGLRDAAAPRSPGLASIGGTGSSTAPSATAMRCAAKPSASSRPARHPFTRRSCSVS